MFRPSVCVYAVNLCRLKVSTGLQSFEGREERDSATVVPDGYEPPNFQTVALQHTNVQLTWDADDDGRKRALSAKRATQADIREDDFKVAPRDRNGWCMGASWREVDARWLAGWLAGKQPCGDVCHHLLLLGMCLRLNTCNRQKLRLGPFIAFH